MRGYRIWLSLLVLIGLVIAPSSSAKYKSRELLFAISLVDTSLESAYVVSGENVSNLLCEVNLASIVGGGNVQLKIIACFPDEVAEKACVDSTDGHVIAVGTDRSSSGSDLVRLMPFAAVNDAATFNDVEVVMPIPPVWMIVMVETGTTTLAYGVDCMWW